MTNRWPLHPTSLFATRVRHCHLADIACNRWSTRQWPSYLGLAAASSSWPSAGAETSHRCNHMHIIEHQWDTVLIMHYSSLYVDIPMVEDPSDHENLTICQFVSLLCMSVCLHEDHPPCRGSIDRHAHTLDAVSCTHLCNAVHANSLGMHILPR